MVTVRGEEENGKDIGQIWPLESLTTKPAT